MVAGGVYLLNEQVPGSRGDLKHLDVTFFDVERHSKLRRERAARIRTMQGGALLFKAVPLGALPGPWYFSGFEHPPERGHQESCCLWASL